MSGLWTLGYVLGMTAFCVVIGLLITIKKMKNDIRELKSDIEALKIKNKVSG